MKSTVIQLLLLLLLGGSLLAQEQTDTNPKGYRLFGRDLIEVTVHGEPDMTVQRRVDAGGTVSLPLIGSVQVVGLTLEQAQKRIADAYVAGEIFIRPQVGVTVHEYAAREISVLGQVRSPGRITFPIEARSLSIVEAVSQAGGFTRIGKSDSVRVTRMGADDREETFTVNVERMLDGRGGSEPFPILPGDVIFVPERVF
jgi:protein involved in polysaccharide export with SLBB domain